jgi:hypothetical protein
MNVRNVRIAIWDLPHPDPFYVGIIHENFAFSNQRLSDGQV